MVRHVDKELLSNTAAETHSPQHPDQLRGPPSLISIGYWGAPLSREADHSPPSSDEVKNALTYTSILLYVCRKSLPLLCKLSYHKLCMHCPMPLSVPVCY
jgi:hypothetical protein